MRSNSLNSSFGDSLTLSICYAALKLSLVSMLSRPSGFLKLSPLFEERGVLLLLSSFSLSETCLVGVRFDSSGGALMPLGGAINVDFVFGGVPGEFDIFTCDKSSAGFFKLSVG